MGGDDDAVLKTYRYLRFGMIGAVVLLAASVLIEHTNAPDGCWQTSISAYYFTPVRTVFVGVMMAIGLSLIVIKGSTWAEDWCLNAAGFLAPVVAFVPTTDSGTCWSVPLQSFPTTTDSSGDKVLADWVVANVDNNMEALLWVGLFGVVVTAVVTIVALVSDSSKEGDEETGGLRGALTSHVEMVAGLVAGVVGLAIAAILIDWSDFTTYAHGTAAIVMFFFLGLAAFANGWDCRKHRRPRYSKVYFGIAGLMGITAGLFVTSLVYKVLFIEVLEITLFVAFWSVQSRELWDSTLRDDRRSPAGRPAILTPPAA